MVIVKPRELLHVGDRSACQFSERGLRDDRCDRPFETRRSSVETELSWAERIVPADQSGTTAIAEISSSSRGSVASRGISTEVLAGRWSPPQAFAIATLIAS